MEPVYIKTYQTGLLDEKIKASYKCLESCVICPRHCNKNRLDGEMGFCKTEGNAMIASYNLHFGEEEPLVKDKGSGTIFFSNCNLLCNFCQNFDISHKGEGIEVTDENLAGIMLNLQSQGALNINFVTPSHVVPMILSGLKIAIEHGLNIPLIYNTGAYDSEDTLLLLDGIIDIYMPDFKFWDNRFAKLTCNVSDYREVAIKAVKEMHRQVGDFILDKNKIAYKGLLIRHLVMPSRLSCTRNIMHFLATEISISTYVNLMSQYRPCAKASEIEEIAKPLSPEEFRYAKKIASEEGLLRLDF